DGKIISRDEYKEMQDFATQIVAQLQGLPERPRRAALLGDAHTLVERVDAKAASAEIAQRASELRRGLIAAYGIKVAPRTVPDLKAAAARFERACAGCHGATGHGDGKLAA